MMNVIHWLEIIQFRDVEENHCNISSRDNSATSGGLILNMPAYTGRKILLKYTWGLRGEWSKWIRMSVILDGLKDVTVNPLLHRLHF